MSRQTIGQDPYPHALYRIQEGSPDERSAVEAHLPSLKRLASGMRDRILTAWVTVWRSSLYADLNRMPYSLWAPGYSLLRHVWEVTECGLLLADYARQRWSEEVHDGVLLPVLLLHDVDKPLLYVPSDKGVVLSPEAGVYPHGVLGAMILREMGFDDAVTSVVATHATYSPFHSARAEGWILHYADIFATDYVARSVGEQPYYLGRGPH